MILGYRKNLNFQYLIFAFSILTGSSPLVHLATKKTIRVGPLFLYFSSRAMSMGMSQAPGFPWKASRIFVALVKEKDDFLSEGRIEKTKTSAKNSKQETFVTSINHRNACPFIFSSGYFN
jgi:hypothetical protein